ncbi:TPA: polysaccharide pyruvyl transferase family protein, partial [Streptococcus suis]
EFQKNFLKLSENKTNRIEELNDENYSVVVAGSDQVWNITIEDGDDAYFLPWVTQARKVAYAPSFGSKNISKYSDDIQKYRDLINNFDALSIRENNGRLWLKELINKDVPVLLDPTLLLTKNEYLPLISNDIIENDKYIFFYSPGYDSDICRFIKMVANKYGYKVISWSEKNYRKKLIQRFGFELPKYENPSAYLYYIQNAQLVFTTSFHGTIFSALFGKKFFTLKNGGMYGDDDRVRTLVETLGIADRLIKYDFDDSFDYLSECNYATFFEKLELQKKISLDYIKKEIIDYYA